MRAVCEWITVATLLRIEYLRAAGIADRSIGSDARAVFTIDAFGNAEVFKVEQVQDLRFNIFDLRQRRRFDKSRAIPARSLSSNYGMRRTVAGWFHPCDDSHSGRSANP